MKTQLKTNKVGIWGAICGAAVAVCLSQATPASAVSVGALPNISALTPYAAMGNFINENLFTINGNVGVSKNGTFLMSSPSYINGRLDLDTGVSTTIGDPTHISGGINQPVDLSLAQNQVINASTTLKNLAADFTYGNVSVPGAGMNFNAVTPGGVTVIDFASLTSGGNIGITLTGTASDYFVINVSGAVSFTGDGGITGLGGVNASHILLNFYSAGSLGTVAHINNVLNGTIFVPYGDATFHSANGAVYSGTNEITLMSGGTITGVPFTPPSVPDAVSTALLLAIACGFLVFGIMGRKKLA